MDYEMDEQMGVPKHTKDFLENWSPLTDLEMEIIADAGALWGKICQMVNTDAARERDLQELMAPIHEIQRAVMAQAAARIYPHLYRPLGGGRAEYPRKQHGGE